MARVYSFWIFDRHCNAIYHQTGRTSMQPLPPPAEVRATTSASSVPVSSEAPLPPQRPGEPSLPNVTRAAPSTWAATQQQQQQQQQQSKNASTTRNGMEQRGATIAMTDASASELLPFDEEAKLVYGVVFSLRNMLHNIDIHPCTPSNTDHVHFVILTDPVPPPSSIPSRSSEGYSIGNASAALRPWVDNVVKNPLLRALEREERVVDPSQDAEDAGQQDQIKLVREASWTDPRV
ncbi:related to BET5 - component of the TRAPP complex [Ustilago trichophora]|uniref:Related to BET5 - component of the TRAPP complex n=1 Tax=Ustilago trichophora TaxID=86804 RepID=A0A5C3E9B7_9BASI|nr:related to BET5 - component of the TRAPP complex [Ustilago trichophora]